MLQHVLLPAPDVVSTSRPSWVNFTGCHAVRQRIEFKLAVLVYKAMNGLSPPVLSKVDDFATFKKVEVHAKNSTF